MPEPELKMTSTKSRVSGWNALPSQWGNVISVRQPIAARRWRIAGASRRRQKMSKSFVWRSMPVYRSNA